MSCQHFPSAYLCQYTLLSVFPPFSGGTAAEGEVEEPDQPTWSGDVAQLPSLDAIHNLIYEKFSKAELKGMKLTVGKKGKGKATRSAKKVSLQLNLHCIHYQNWETVIF